MALIKSKIIKGIDCSYWKIVDCNVKTGQVMIAPYINKEAAKVRENMMEGRTAFHVDFPVDVTNPLAYAYGKIKESNKEVRVVTPAVPAVAGVEAVEAVLDEQGSVITEAVEAVAAVEAVPAVTEEVELNWFADAVND